MSVYVHSTVYSVKNTQYSVHDDDEKFCNTNNFYHHIFCVGDTQQHRIHIAQQVAANVEL